MYYRYDQVTADLVVSIMSDKWRSITCPKKWPYPVKNVTSQLTHSDLIERSQY